ncbi:glycoside hydrolase family 38 N-terminal domain-containing protein [Companilactobacillus hulinensis]|uniref:glycoside hydrolase family 38 N-terminal domain-containing protein n=1 Tax=Companilactobacillus hulinensis TaxID=2486007 RepID=UPI000F792359|nr:glycoside hydrolase family 38 C-terminal domain-containing protein [Companilactobacillus hulinensis]
MKNIHAIAHTHWDFEWYFTRQEARVQFAYHMDDVFEALETNKLNYYLLDGQMSIIDDYLTNFPEKKDLFTKFITAKRLFVGPWYTQIDEMVTSGESIVRNLSLGTKLANELGGVMKVGYLPDSFGQGQDMPKIFNGFDIYNTVFWRGMPKEKNCRYFYWNSNDGSKVLTANIKNGYYAGVELIEKDDFNTLFNNISTDTDATELVLPVGGDQRAIDFNLKDRIKQANEKSSSDFHIKESNYPKYFEELAKCENLPTYSGEFIDPSASKIHRGIYSSRADLKQIYDKLERRMTYQVEPLIALAAQFGIPNKQGLVDDIWKTIARGQAHDSSGGCNSDKTNSDILHRAKVADQLSYSIIDYLVRKLSISQNTPFDLFLWNPLPVLMNKVQTVEVSTKNKSFELQNEHGQKIEFDIIEQSQQNSAPLRRNLKERKQELYYVTTISFKTVLEPMSWQGLQINELENKCTNQLHNSDNIENTYYRISIDNGELTLLNKDTKKTFNNFLTFEDSGDDGDTYDYSPMFNDWGINLDFKNADEVHFVNGTIQSKLTITGSWKLPLNLKTREERVCDTQLPYKLVLILNTDSPVINYNLEIDNTVLDHRLRLVLNTDVSAENSYSDTPFGTIARPVNDLHLNDWQEIGYREEPTSMRPMIHFANTHSNQSSWTYIGLGAKDFQIIGDNYDMLAITMFRGIGFLGKPDLLRRPSDASGLETRYVETPESQLQGKNEFNGGIIITDNYSPAEIQAQHLQLSSGTLYYQDQSLNRFTNPLRYFMMNELDEPITHKKFFNLDAEKLVLSSISTTSAGTGFELRLYNPTDEVISAPGYINFDTPVSLALLTLNSEFKESLDSEVQQHQINEFQPGEIRTYGIYLLNN